MTLDDLLGFHRVADPQLSPDGQFVAFVVTEVERAENRTNSDIWLARADGSVAPRKLTNSPKSDSHPRWSPDGRWILFESTRDGDSQLYLVPRTGGQPRRVTSLSTGASDAVWSADGKSIAFVSEVYPEFSDRPFAEADRLNRQRDDAADKSKVKAREFDHLLYRHWTEWVGEKRKHLFVLAMNAHVEPVGDPRDVTPGENDGVPAAMSFEVGDDYAFSPDGTEIVTACPPVPIREQAWSTNYDVWAIDLRSGQRRNLTADNPAADGFPRYSPDGRYLAYRAQRVAGFEADRWELWLLDRTTGQRRSVTAHWDRSVGHFVWAPDGASIYVETPDNAEEAIFRVSLADGTATPVVQNGSNGSVSISRDGRWLAFTQAKLTQPPEVMRLDVAGGNVQAVTRLNAALLAPLAFTAPESVVVPGAGGTPVQMWIVKPPFFDPAKKYPFVFWVHGGPQGTWNDGWSTRWNAEIWAAQGYVLAMPNPRGSEGFGQQFTNEISRDWGGKVFDDLMACLAYMKQQPYVDTSRMAAAGASFGGYMMNWFQGHVHEFRCLVCHDGVYNFSTMYTSTDELWFDEHEHGIPWETPDFEKFSPHRFAADWSTPMFIVHNELDFRCPLSEGMAAFTTLQRKGIPSKLLIFPDEGHWVLKPQNSERWHREIFAWLHDYLK
jgi:dipeptidyl aminopeptidase/acylaminoacyl peptidase